MKFKSLSSAFVFRYVHSGFYAASRTLSAAIAALLIAPSANAADITWSGTTNTWNTDTNWVGSVLPVSGDSLIFGTPGAGGLLLNNDRTSGSFTVASILFTGEAGAYVIGDGTTTANLGNTFVLGAPAATAPFTLSVTNASTTLQTINTPFSMTATRAFTGAGDITLAGNISGTSGALTKAGGNILTLSGSNTYTGQTSIGGGVLRLDSANAVPGGIGSTGGTSNINFNGGIIGLGVGDFTRSLGNTASTVQFGNPGGWAAYGNDRVVNLGGASASVTWATATTGLNGKTLILGHSTATHMVDFQNPLDMTNGGRTVQVDNGTAAIDGKLSGNITGVASGNLTKTGDGTLALTGTNNYVGTTTVNAGTLLVNGNNSGGGAFTVNAAGTLGGTGTVSGTVTASTGGRINLRDGMVGTLSLTKTGTSLTLSGTAAAPNHLFFDLGNGAGGTDKIVTAGAHAAATASGALVHLNQLSGGAVDPGTYTLIQGGAASTFTGYTLATERAGRNVYSALGASGNNLDVTVAAGNAGPADPFTYWRGETQTDWDLAQWYSDAAGTTTSAMPGYSSNVRFATTNGNNLSTNLFTDFEINSLTVDSGLVGPVAIATKMLTLGATTDNGNTAGNGITANNENGTTISSRVGLGSSQTWTVGTGAALTVSGAVSDFGNCHALTKAGAGTLTLTGVNTFSGPLTVSGGTLDIGGAGQLNSGSHGAAIVNNGTLSYSSSVNQTLNGIISGTGSLTKSGGSTLTLNIGGTFTGGATISGGTLSLGVANLVNPLGLGTTTVNTGGTYALSATLITAPLVLNGGTVTAGNSFGSSINGPVSLDANSTISISGNLTINSNISGTGGLTKSNTAFVPLNGTNNDYSGPTVISAGGLTIKSSLYGNDTAKWIPDNITVNSGAALVMNVGGAGEFTIAQAGLMFSQLGGTVNNNGLKAGSVFGVDLRTAGGSFTISDNLIDSSGPGGGAVGFRIVGNGTTGAATVELTGNNTYSGVTVVDRSGTIKVSSLNSVDIADLDPNLPLPSSSLGRPTTVANGTIQLGSNVSFQGGSLTYTGTGETTDRVLNLGGANGTTYRLDQSGTGLLKFTSPFTITDNRGAKTIELQGSTDGTGEIAGAIPFGQSSAAPNRLTKNGTGTWTLSAANLYDGVTTVNAGALVLANAEALKGGIGATGGLGALTFNGGVIGLGAGDFFRPLVAENTIGGVNFKNTAGGWAAYGADRVVNLGGASASVTWATASTGFNGRTLILGNATATHMVTLQNPLDMGAATRTVQVDDGAATIDGTLSGVLAGTAGGLTKTGTGTLALTASNSYAGTTTVSAGTLFVNNTTGSGTGISNVSVTLGTLGGTGSISGDVTIGNSSGSADSILAPGTSIGTIATGNLTFSSDGSYACEVNGTSITSDQVNVTGTVILDATTTLAVNVAGSLSPSQQYVIVSNDGGDAVTGTFATLAQDAVVGNFGGTDLKISYSGGDGNDIVLYTDASGSTYDTWAALKGLDGTPGKDPAKNADPDNDGRNNLDEFAFDGNPLSGTNDGKIVGKVATVGGNQVMTLTLPVRAVASFSPDSGDQLSALIDGIYYRIEGDVNLSTFADTITEVTGGDATAIQAGLPALSATPAPGWTYRTFRHSGTVPATPKAFLRAKVSETP